MPFFKELGKIASIAQLLEEVEAVIPPSEYRFDSIYLRGQAVYAWTLRPTIARPLEYAGLRTAGYDKSRELYLLHRFRRYVRPLVGDLAEKELLLLARHHGIPVRLLDWTKSPLVALYFACVEDRWLSEDGAVWAFVGCQYQHDYFYDFFTDPQPLFKLPGVKIIYAPYVSERIPAQSANFTIQQFPDRDLEAYGTSGCGKDFDIERIVKWRVLKHHKAILLQALERCGINERTMFPDLDGIARGINRTEVLQTGEVSPSRKASRGKVRL